MMIVMVARYEARHLGTRDGAQQQYRKQHTQTEGPSGSHLAGTWMPPPPFRLHFISAPLFLWENRAESIHF